MESEWGFTSIMYSWISPSNTVKPGGKAQHVSISTYTQIHSSQDILDKIETRKMKTSRDNNWFNRQASIISHHFLMNGMGTVCV